MDFIVDNFTTFVMVGIVVVVGASQFHRPTGAVLGLVFWVLVAVFGHFLYAAGGAIGFPGLELSEPVFLIMCLGFMLLQVYGLRSYYRAMERRRAMNDERREIGR